MQGINNMQISDVQFCDIINNECFYIEDLPPMIPDSM